MAATATKPNKTKRVSFEFFESDILPIIDFEPNVDAKDQVLAYLKKKMIEVVDEDGNPLDLNATLIVHAAKAEDEDEEGQKGETDEDQKAETDDDETDDAKSVIRLLRKELERTVQKSAAANGISVKVKGLAAQKDRKFGWKSMGDQLLAIKNHAVTGGDSFDDRLKVKAEGMNITNASDGGFLLAPEFSDRILEIMHDEEPLLDRCDTFDINGPSVKVNAIDETSRADGSRMGGVRGYWVAEAGTITKSKPKFREVQINPHKLAVLVYMTEELLADGGSMMENMVQRGAAAEIAFLTGNAVFNGNGAGQPLGILNSGATVEVAKETGQAAETLVFENITNMFSRLHTSARKNAAWFIDQSVEPQLHGLNAAIGTGGQLVYMPPGGLSQEPFGTLYGRPIVPTEFGQKVGTKGDIILADLKHYLAATRGAVKAAMSMHVQFVTDELAFRFTFRVDGQPWWASALTPKSGGPTQSPFVTLATRA